MFGGIDEDDDAVVMMQEVDGQFLPQLPDPRKVLDDVLREVTDGAKDTVNESIERGKQVVADRGASAVEQILRSTEFQQVLVKIQDATEERVTEVVAKNALNLMLLAVAGGTLGGIVFKGRVGVVTAAGLAVYAGSKLMQGAKV